jgi:quinoprotein glucose dehydrogenase
MLLACVGACVAEQGSDWPVTGGNVANTRYAELRQINRDNVSRLRVAWTYHTGEPRGEIQATPIVVGGVLYTTTSALNVVALRADSGTQIWRFDPFATRERTRHANRGVAYWADGNDRRIFFSAGRRLYALDASTGRVVPTFGDSGSVDLAKGLSREIRDEYLVATTPGVVYKDLLIQGTRVGEGQGSAPGDVRAYDVRTGAIRWTFHTIPHPGEFGHDTWPPDAWRTAGGANSWPGMSVDVRRGIVFVPTGSATPDFYGGDRPGANLFATTLLALDASTGNRRWHFQTVHHDVWDRDLPAAPNLVTVARGAKRIDAVAQITKSGFVFVFDRETGEPLFPIEERGAPPSDLSGEHAWPTQPIPVLPKPFARQFMADSDVTNISPGAHDAALARYRKLRPSSLYMPPSREGTIVLPGFDGGGEWGGAAVDPDGVLYVNASDVPWIAAMRESTRGPPRYEFAGYERWRDSSGFPAIRPPWGTLSAIDLNSGEYRWRITLGEHAALTARGVPVTGTEQYGGPIVTAGGLLFIAATMDGKFRAFDRDSGKLLWETTLPAPGYATPATYAVRGKQYVVIAAGGAKLGSPSSDAYVAFALP